MNDMDYLIAFLLKQLAMDEQTARAMPHAIEHLESRWSPVKLIADCQAKRTLVEFLRRLADCDCESHGHHQDAGVSLKEMALPYAHLRGYREEWRP